jgi:hypothetical protein
VARYDLGLSETEIGRSTPRILAALLERWRLEQERRDYRSAIVATILVNTNRKKGTKAHNVEEFMPHYRRPKPRQLTVEETIEFVAAINAALGGTDRRASKQRQG